MKQILNRVVIVNTVEMLLNSGLAPTVKFLRLHNRLYEVLYVEPLGKRHLTMKQSIKYLNTRIDHAINECCNNVEITPTLVDSALVDPNLTEDDLCPLDCNGTLCEFCAPDKFDASDLEGVDGYFPY